MRHVAIFRFSGAHIPVMYGALKPELGDMGRSCVEMSLEGDGTLVLKVSAEDISALRAALNTWLRLMNVTKEMQEIVGYE
jgi:KEOPS complex subunit Pcc1